LQSLIPFFVAENWLHAKLYETLTARQRENMLLTILAWAAGLAAAPLETATIPAGAKVAVMAGTFDPITLGHERLVQWGLDNGFDFVVVIPDTMTSHKENATPHPTRLAMTQAAFADEPRILVPSIDGNYGERFASGVMKALNSRPEPIDAAIFIGADAVERYQKIPRQALGATSRFVVFDRIFDSSSTVPDNIQGIPVTVVSENSNSVSSTGVREFLKNNPRFFAGAIPEERELPLRAAVIDYIRRNKLYIPPCLGMKLTHDAM
jgi:nicotinic acid mononucleotide adenylyltransferase